MSFELGTILTPAGDQPKAIDQLVKNVNLGAKSQVLLGVTGSGKTYTMASTISRLKKPALVIAHNKTLAAQLASEFRKFFPSAAVEYFVSYYDYYQPEAYLPNSDTYIEKEATINDEIDRLRHSATQSILNRADTIVVSSVSCIYGLGSPSQYEKKVLDLSVGKLITRKEILDRLIGMQYKRNDAELTRGSFRARGNQLEIMPINTELIYRIMLDDDKIGMIEVVDNVSRNILEKPDSVLVFPAKHYVVDEKDMKLALAQIESDLESQVKKFTDEGKFLEAERISRRTRYDLEMLREIGYCNGVENYSRYFDGRKSGEPPFTLIDYFYEGVAKGDFLLFIDESHVTVPQLNGMYAGDKSRKETLVDFGFRLPAAIDNRPLKFEEFKSRMPSTIFVSATPGQYEYTDVKGDDSLIAEQIVRPTGLIDPEVSIRPSEGQVEDVIREVKARTESGERTLVTTLTKKMAEDLTQYLKEKGIKVNYLHSEVETLDRIAIIKELREGKFDCLVGVNLLREGLDLPEVSLVVILDADKEGFLRSETALIQTIGRAARNVNGKVIMYADNMTGSIGRALKETKRRREIQLAYNKEHGITPTTIISEIKSILSEMYYQEPDEIERRLSGVDLKSLIAQKTKDMKRAAEGLSFEEAAILRDQILKLKKTAKIIKD